MKYKITETQLEKLQQQSRERHKDSADKMHKSGSFDLNGKNVEYTLTTKRNSVFSNVKLIGNSYKIFIMNEMDFILLDQKEQKKIAEYRIKKFLEKKLSLKEDLLPKPIKRRFSEDQMRKFLDQQLETETDICDEYGDQFEFADNVIARSLDDFLTVDEDIMYLIGDDFDHVHSVLTDYMKQWFGMELMEQYMESCDEILFENVDQNDKMIDKIHFILKTFGEDEWLCGYEVGYDESAEKYFVTVITSKSFDEQRPVQKVFWKSHFEKEIYNKISDYLSTSVDIGFKEGNC